MVLSQPKSHFEWRGDLVDERWRLCQSKYEQNYLRAMLQETSINSKPDTEHDKKQNIPICVFSDLHDEAASLLRKLLVENNVNVTHLKPALE